MKNSPNWLKLPFWFTYGTLGCLFMILGMLVTLIWLRGKLAIIPNNTIAQINAGIIRLDSQTGRYILRSSLPVLDRVAEEEDPFTLIHFNWSELYWKLAANIRNATPKEILKAQFPLLALVNPRPVAILPPRHETLIKPPELASVLPEISPRLPQNPTVLIYHTHTSESYIPVSGKDHQLDAKGDIVQVGAYLQKVLEDKYHLKCFHSEEIHDQFPFRDSYKRSQLTLTKYLKELPTIKVVLDVHRDATPGVKATTSINSQETATIMIVVGSDKMGLAHPDWKKNYHFATSLAETMNLYYPGLCSGVVVSDARYNQHLNDHALIIEFGDQYVKLEEVYRAVDLFAEALTLIMNQDFGNLTTASSN